MRIARDLLPATRPPETEVERDPGLPESYDEDAFHAEMERSDFATELFVSTGHAAWDRGRFTLRPDDRGDAATDISGVRFQPYDRAREDLSLERETQLDVVELVRGLRRLRRLPGLDRLVLLGDDQRLIQPIRGKGTRVKFGLRVPGGQRAKEDVDAAARSHRAIHGAIRHSGLIVEHPKAFDPKTGLAGLEQWGGELLLRKRRWPWWLLLLPLLLLPLLLKDCSAPDRFLGFSIETESLLVVVDKSGSMQSLFATVQDEAKQTLSGMRAGFLRDRYADVIVYDGRAESALGGIQKVDEQTETRLNQFLDQLTPGGDTNLGSALELAAQEVAQHGKPTTLVILTDGEGDASIRQTLADMDGYLEKFQGVEIIGHTTTPRLLTEGGRTAPQPLSPDEDALSRLAAGMGGSFGPRER